MYVCLFVFLCLYTVLTTTSEAGGGCPAYVDDLIILTDSSIAIDQFYEWPAMLSFVNDVIDGVWHSNLRIGFAAFDTSVGFSWDLQTAASLTKQQLQSAVSNANYLGGTLGLGSKAVEYAINIFDTQSNNNREKAIFLVTNSLVDEDLCDLRQELENKGIN